MSYIYRGCPCTIANGKPWSISGVYINMRDRSREGGVLEWCYSEDDAKLMIEYMRQFPGMVNLKIDPPETCTGTGIHPQVKRLLNGV